MAEGHAVHGMALRVRRLVGERGRSSGPVTPTRLDPAPGVYPMDPAVLDGLTVRGAEAHGKHLLVHLDGTDLSPHLHLGMHGRVSVRAHRRVPGEDGLPRTDPPITPGLAWRLLTSAHLLEVTRPTVCELLDADGRAALHGRLGPDPLRDDADPELAVARLGRSRRPIGQLLLDQGVVSGIGNVYRAELLWRAGIAPQAPGSGLDAETLRRLWEDAIDLMTIGLGAGWIVTEPGQLALARELLVRGEAVPRWPTRYAVYSRAGQACRRCAGTVRAERMGLQTVFWCPGCQRALPPTAAG